MFTQATIQQRNINSPSLSLSDNDAGASLPVSASTQVVEADISCMRVDREQSTFGYSSILHPPPPHLPVNTIRPSSNNPIAMKEDQLPILTTVQSETDEISKQDNTRPLTPSACNEPAYFIPSSPLSDVTDMAIVEKPETEIRMNEQSTKKAKRNRNYCDCGDPASGKFVATSYASFADCNPVK